MTPAPMRLGVCILTDRGWAEHGPLWRRAEEMGFHSAWTYDHLRWTRIPGPWITSVPVLAAAAATTSRVRLGTLVSTPNFRNPVLFAKEVVALDDVSGGRFTVGLGAGGPGSDAGVLGDAAPKPPERAARFAEFADCLDHLLRADGETGVEGARWRSDLVQMGPGCRQRPRVPLYLAATGRRGLDAVARHADAWVTLDAPSGRGTLDEGLADVRRHLDRLERACAERGRDPAGLGRLMLTGFASPGPLESLGAFHEVQGRAAELGVTELVLHWPRARSPFAGSERVLEQVAPGAG